MSVRVGINGFGRMGRLAARLLEDRLDLELVAVNETGADAAVMATLLEFDSIQGRWNRSCRGEGDRILVGEREVAFGNAPTPAEIDWAAHEVELVFECTGRFRRSELLRPHLERGARRVVVSAPVKDGPPNIVVGVNHGAFDLAAHPVLTAASCTTNCLAPVVQVMHAGIGIRRGLVTTIHDPTNTQSVVDAPHADPRRARASQLNLVPTSTNSATAVTMILPELAGKLDSVAVRAPVLNASLTDCVLQMARDTTVEEVNALFAAAAAVGPLVGILGIETRPLVSSDFRGDPRSAIVDALSTRVTDGSLVKVLAWYDNEWGYVNRMVELAAMASAADRR
ncbi:MAG: ArsJ-associated glyceraldehyde-3-phosphate dehydrogenase [Planctomycetota bacterium]